MRTRDPRGRGTGRGPVRVGPCGACLGTAVRYIIQSGTDWHAEESRRPEIEQWFRSNFSVEHAEV